MNSSNLSLLRACEARFQRGPNKGRVKTGTKTGYIAHRTAGEDACEACLLANRQAATDWQNTNRELHREVDRSSYARNREKRRERMRKRRAAIKALPGSASEEERANALAFHGGLCWYDLENPATLFDHLIPVFAEGSTNNISNLIPCCTACNSSKKDTSLEEWRPDLVERIELDIVLS